LQEGNSPISQLPSDAAMVTAGKPGYGDYQSNVALIVAKSMKMKPADVCAKVMTAVQACIEKQRRDGAVVPPIGSMDMTGPGFLNIHLSEEYITKKLAAMSRREQDGSSRLGIDRATCPERVVVDFSSPNIAKEMHVGHLRSTIIGDCVSRVLEFQGHEVLRLNHVGDWGTQFGMLVLHLRQLAAAAAEESKGDTHVASSLQTVSISDLLTMYKTAKQRFDEDVTFREAARQEVVRLQSGEPDSLAVWAAVCAKSRAAFQEIYDLLGVRLTERGESFYNGALPGLVLRLQEAGLAVESQGALCIFLEGFKASDGTDLPLVCPS
jgi:arginyl-tRNA synthetase